MKYFFSLIFCLVGYIQMDSQTVNISEEIQLRNDYSYDILGLYDGRTFLFRNKIYKQEIQVFDSEMNMIREKEITLEDRKVNIIGVLDDTEFFSIIYSYRQRGDVYLMLQQFDGDLMPKDTAYVIKLFENQLLTPDFEFERSENREYCLVYTTDRDNEMDVFVVNLQERQIVWENRFLLKNTNLRREFRKITVSNQGDMHLMVEKNNFMSQLDEHVLEFYHFGPGFDVVNYFFFPLYDQISFDVSFKYDNLNNSIAVAGLYSEKNFGKANGVYMFKHDFLSDDPKITYISLNDKILLDLYGKNVNNDKGVADLEIQEILLRQDGGLMLITEIKKEYSRRPYYTERSYYGSSYNFQTDFHYEDLVVFSIHPDGKSHWNTVLHKRQYSHDDNAIYSSFFVFKTPSKIRLIYNDEISRENTVSEYVITGNGELIRNSLMSTEYQNLQLRFKDAKQVSSTQFIVPSQRQLKLNLVKVDYK